MTYADLIERVASATDTTVAVIEEQKAKAKIHRSHSMESRGSAKTCEKRELEMSAIDDLLGKSAQDAFCELMTIYLVGLAFGFGFWMAWRVVT